MIEFVNKEFKGAQGRGTLLDARISSSDKAVIVFAHGYKGYKDWGCWRLMEEKFVQNGFGFVKFNFSHNGGTVTNPIDFDDLEAFGKNTYSFELEDLSIVTDEVARLIQQEMKLDLPIFLIGHSRGGGVCTIYANEDDRIKKMISLAGISDIGSRFPIGDELVDWKREGVRYILNGRTKQEMPHYISFYEDFVRNAKRLNIENAAQNLTIPFLQIHGDMDLAVSISEGQNMAKWTNTRLAIVKGAGHTFGASHPWESNDLPPDFEDAIGRMIDFFADQ